MKKFKLIFLSILYSCLLAACGTISTDDHSSVLEDLLATADRIELIEADMVWDGGSMIYVVAYTGNFDGEREMHVFCTPFENPHEAQIYVACDKRVFSRPKDCLITSEKDKKALLEIFSDFNEYMSVDTLIYALSGKRPHREANEEYKVPPRMMEMFLNKLREQK